MACIVNKRKHLIIFIITLSIMLSGYITKTSAEPTESQSNIENRLVEITDEQQRVMEKLFTIVQELEDMEREERSISLVIDNIKSDIREIEQRINIEQQKYDDNRDVLGEVLKTYQRRGSGTFLEIILASESISDFLHRLNILRDLTRNTEALLERLEDSKRTLEREKDSLSVKLTELNEKQAELQASIQSQLELKEELESYLVSLDDEREYYQEQLDNLKTVWDELKILFPHITKEFSKVLTEGNIPPETIEITFSFFSVKGTLEDKALNTIIKQNSNLPAMMFTFSDNAVALSIPDKHLLLKGILVVSDSSTLEFAVDEGYFYELPLEPGSIAELFRDGALTFDLKPILGKSKIQKVEIKEGSLELTILPLLY